MGIAFSSSFILLDVRGFALALEASGDLASKGGGRYDAWYRGTWYATWRKRKGMRVQGSGMN